MQRTVPVVPLILLLVAACQGSGPVLRDERSAQPQASWLGAAAGCAHDVERVPAQGPGEPPLALEVHAVRCDQPADDRLLVLLPGILADAATWRFLAPLLARRNDVLIVDPPGTGGSDGPDPARTPEPAWTPGWAGRLALRAAARWQAARGDTRRLLLVGHSMGSAAWVRALTEPGTCAELSAACARIDGLVLLAFPDVLLTEASPLLEDIATITDVEVHAGVALGIVQQRVREGVYQGVVAPERRAMRQEAERLQRMLTEDRTRHAAQAMLRRWRPLDPSGEPRWDEARAIADRERTLRHPVLLVWGMQDATLPHAMAARVAARLPHVERLDIPDARHSAHQERADLVAWRIARFLSDHR